MYKLNYTTSTKAESGLFTGAQIIIFILVVIIVILLYIIYRMNSQIKNLQNTQIIKQEPMVVTANHPSGNNSCGNNKQQGAVAAEQNNSKIVVALYYATWCGYSREFLPVWKQFKDHMTKKYADKFIFKDADCTDQTSASYDEQCKSVNGFPTIIFYSNNKPPVNYSGARTIDSLEKFSVEVMNK